MESLKGNVNDSGDNVDKQNFSKISVKIYNEKSTGDDDKRPTVPIQNINELKVLDLFSADDVRQSLKSALTVKAIYKSNEIAVCKKKEILSKPISNVCEKAQKEDILLNSQVASRVKEANPSVNETDVQERGRKRRGIPIKPGSSKNPPKRHKIVDFYIGKLSNFVPYKRKGDSESDFDSEFGVLY